MSKLIIILSILLFLPSVASANGFNPPIVLFTPFIFFISLIFLPAMILLEVIVFYLLSHFVFKAKLGVLKISFLVILANLLSSPVGAVFPIAWDTSYNLSNLTLMMAARTTIELAFYGLMLNFGVMLNKAKLKKKHLAMIVILGNTLSFMMVITMFPSGFLFYNTVPHWNMIAIEITSIECTPSGVNIHFNNIGDGPINTSDSMELERYNVSPSDCGGNLSVSYEPSIVEPGATFIAKDSGCRTGDNATVRYSLALRGRIQRVQVTCP